MGQISVEKEGTGASEEVEQQVCFHAALPLASYTSAAV